MSHPSSSSPYININNRPSSEILQDFQTYTITIPMHEQHLSLQLDSSHRDQLNLIEHSLSLHLDLSIVEHILLRCESTKFWLKDHFYPQHHILFKDEMILTIDHQQEIRSVLDNVDRWPAIIFKKNSQICQMLHERKCSSNNTYGLYVLSGEEDDRGGNIFMDFQLIEQAAKVNKEMQCIYGVMFAVKYLHEFSHFIYSTYGRAHLLTHYGTPMKETKYTPDGILKGESGKFEESMLGFILLHARHANISMNIKQCLGHSTLTSHLRSIPSEFLEKIFKKETYQVDPMPSNFLHYSNMEFCALERFSFDKAADLQAFYPEDDDETIHATPFYPLSLTDDETTDQYNADQDNLPLKAFIPAKDKLV